MINHKSLSIAIATLALSLSHSALSAQPAPLQDVLKTSRETVIAQYIQDLQKADYQDITQLFDKNGMVVSTSRGEVSAKEFFYGFLSEIASAKTELHHYFIDETDADRMAARFHFTYALKDGEAGNGEYIDEFVFMKDSSKLAAVYMFENLHVTRDPIKE